MTLTILTLIAGLVMVVLGADWLVEGASAVARRAGLSEFVIGLTIVGFGTSCPELVVSLTGAIQGNADVSAGNILGSNICNTMLILGLTAVIAPFAVSRKNRLKDLPILFFVTLLFVLFALNSTLLGIGSADILSRVEGIVMLLVFAAYMYFCFKSPDDQSSQDEEEAEPSGKTRTMGLSIFWIIVGLGALIEGGSMFVNSAIDVAKVMGVSDKFIAVTILAVGTSLPEIATCVKAAAKNKHQMVLGDVIGSNLFNLLFILGLSSSITPLSMASLEIVDVCLLLVSAGLLWLWAYTGKKEKIDRWEGAVLLIGYIAYMAYLIITL